MAWDADKPAGTQKIRLADDDIRANNAALEDALGRDHEFPGVMSSTAGMHNVVQLIDQAGDEAAHATAIKLWNNAGALKAISPGGSALKMVLMAGGNVNVMIFGQNSAPTGWTRKADWQDNAMLCYAASGDIGSGGAVNPQSTHTHVGPSHVHTGPAHTHSMQNHVHATVSHVLSDAEIPTHTHSQYIWSWRDGLGSGTHRYAQGVAAYTAGAALEAAGVGYTGSGGGHDHGNVGVPSVSDTASNGTQNTGAGGAAATGSNSAPFFQEVIAASLD